MHDGGKIILFVIILLVLFTAPVWYNLIGGQAGEEVNPVIATADEPGRDQCVKDTEWMKKHHMDLLNDWRDDVVRRSDRVYVTEDGRKFNKSLSMTCMDCHSNKEEFCDKCHDYLDVTPYCWTCHVEPDLYGERVIVEPAEEMSGIDLEDAHSMEHQATQTGRPTAEHGEGH